jgi:hypothetical protein
MIPQQFTRWYSHCGQTLGQFRTKEELEQDTQSLKQKTQKWDGNILIWLVNDSE